MPNHRVLIASPVRRKPNVLRHFLDGLGRLDLTGIAADFLFVDDNDEEESSALLRWWAAPAGRNFVMRVNPELASWKRPYIDADDWHRWDANLTYRLSHLRNAMIQAAVEGLYTHILMVDSDLVLQPQTLRWMLASGRDVVYEVFWTRFFPHQTLTVPNVWSFGESCQYEPDGLPLTPRHLAHLVRAYYRKLRVPGLYPVGGGGACSLISRRAIDAGCNYAPVWNLGWWGEDRWFQARCAVAGIQQWADTHCPPRHLYRQSDLRTLGAWLLTHDAAPPPETPAQPAPAEASA